MGHREVKPAERLSPEVGPIFGSAPPAPSGSPLIRLAGKRQEGSVLDAAGLAGLSELGAGLIADVVATFIEDANNQVDGMRRAVTIGDPDILRRAAHNLKGSSASVAAMNVAVLCADIEQTASSSDMSEATMLVGRVGVEVARACSALLALFPAVDAPGDKG